MNSMTQPCSILKSLVLSLCLIVSGTTAAVAADQPPAKVKISHVTEENIQEKTELTGVLYFDKVSGISTEVGGLVKNIYFREGDTVKQGDILVRLNTDFLNKDLAIEKTNLDRLSIRIEQKNKNLKRFEELFKKEAASETDFEDYAFSYRELVKEKESLQVKIDRIRLEIAKSIIRAPFDGIILAKNVDVGAWAQIGSPICKIGSTHDLFIQLPVAERLLQFVKTGDPIDLTITAFNKQVVGKIEGLRPTADEKTKNIFLKIRLPNMDIAVENMSARVFMPISEKKQLRMIPRDALVRFQGKDFMYTIQDNKAKIVPLNIVTMAGTSVGVDNPQIQSGMPVVVEGNERLKPEQPVVIAGEK